MKMKYLEIERRHAVLMDAGKLVLPRKAAVAISRNIVKMESELEFYRKQLTDIFGRYAEKDDNGNIAVDKNGNVKFPDMDANIECVKEKRDLDNTEVKIEIMKFKASELDRCEQVERYDILTPLQEAALAWMIDYEDAE